MISGSFTLYSSIEEEIIEFLEERGFARCFDRIAYGIVLARRSFTCVREVQYVRRTHDRYSYLRYIENDLSYLLKIDPDQKSTDVKDQMISIIDQIEQCDAQLQKQLQTELEAAGSIIDI